MNVGVVVTTCAGREENLTRVFTCLSRLDPKPSSLVVVYDGCPPFQNLPHPGFDWNAVLIEKHHPGSEQPRNVGVRKLRQLWPETTHVWLLDSDMIFESTILGRYLEAYDEDVTVLVGPGREQSSAGGRILERVLIGPYEFMPPGKDHVDHEHKTDVRWTSFLEYGPEMAFVNDLGAALACFGGNLVWPVDEFMAVGGYHPQLSHGRVEDGELGLRAASMGVPMSLVRDARAWHVWHPTDEQAKHDTNAREVPLLNQWHPWVQERGLIVTTDDGARFNFRCLCGLEMNCADYWQHASDHEHGREFSFNDPASVSTTQDTE